MSEPQRTFGATPVPAYRIYDAPIEILVPCALGAIINDESLARLKAISSPALLTISLQKNATVSNSNWRIYSMHPITPSTRAALSTSIMNIVLLTIVMLRSSTLRV